MYISLLIAFSSRFSKYETTYSLSFQLPEFYRSCDINYQCWLTEIDFSYIFERKQVNAERPKLMNIGDNQGYEGNAKTWLRDQERQGVSWFNEHALNK